MNNNSPNSFPHDAKVSLPGQHRKFLIIGIDNAYHVVCGLITNYDYPDRLLLADVLYYVPLNFPAHWSDEFVTEKTFENCGLLVTELIPRVVPPKTHKKLPPPRRDR